MNHCPAAHLTRGLKHHTCAKTKAKPCPLCCWQNDDELPMKTSNTINQATLFCYVGITFCLRERVLGSQQAAGPQRYSWFFTQAMYYYVLHSITSCAAGVSWSGAHEWRHRRQEEKGICELANKMAIRSIWVKYISAEQAQKDILRGWKPSLLIVLQGQVV